MGFGASESDLERRRVLAAEVEEYDQYYFGLLGDYYNNAIKMRRLFMNVLKDPRKKSEMWRSFAPMPYGWSALKALSASFADLLFSLDPPIQAQSVSAVDEPIGANLTRTWDYVLRKLKFRFAAKNAHLDSMIQGFSVRKNTLVKITRDIVHFPSRDAIVEFKESVFQAIQEGLEPPPSYQGEEFEEWRQLALQAGYAIPEIPVPGPKRIIKYNGPGFMDTSIFHLRFDPYLNPLQQECIIQHSLKPWEWVEANTLTKKNPNGILDPDAVAQGKGAGMSSDEILEKYDQIGAMYKLASRSLHTDPRLKEPCLIKEAWFPGKPESYRLTLNEKIVANSNMTIPYVHGSHPYIFIRNHPDENMSVGVPELQLVERLIYELTSFRGLRLDAMLMSVVPVFVVAAEAGLGHVVREFMPGLTIKTPRPDALNVFKSDVNPMIFREGAEIKTDIDEALGTPQLRGKTTQPRVSAASAERAFSQALAVVKERVGDYEMELDPFIENSLYMMYQFWNPEERVRIGGKPAADPFVKFESETFLEALEMEFAFRGATSAVNRQQENQELKEWFTILVNAQLPEAKLSQMAEFITERVTRRRGTEFFHTEEEMAELNAQTPPEEGGEGAETSEEPVQ